MDKEFHYYMTYLIAAKAGFSPDESTIIATASQYVDDNDVKVEIDKDLATSYRNYISQTMNITKPKKKLFRIYPLFHFVPGEPECKNAHRHDGKMHWLNTTPDSNNARKIIDKAIATANLYRIGIAVHAFADTWAHQNFVGYYEEFNSMSGVLESVTPNIGHADAQHNPDWPGLVWQDKRLKMERVDNKERFLEAAGHIYEKLATMKTPEMAEDALKQGKKELLADLAHAIGDRDQGNDRVKEREARYIELSSTAAYGDKKIPEYDPDDWFEEAVNEKVRGLRDRSDHFMTRWDPLTDKYTWKDRNNYKTTDWYLFQEAVKAHQNDAWAILEKTNFEGLDLPDL